MVKREILENRKKF